MAKFFGAIGYAHTEQVSPGIHDDVIVERPYYGDVVRATRILQEGEKVNDDLTLYNMLSVVADSFASEHVFAIRYVRWAGSLWKVTQAEIQRPRLLLRLGGVYNGPTPSSPDSP